MRPTPVLVNPSAGSAGAALRVLRDDPRVSVRITAPADVASEARDAAAEGADTVIVAGGDGTLAAAAGALAGGRTALGIVPAGTRNHFARDLELPMEPAASLEVALHGRRARVDVGSVNERTFLNTSAVGAYVAYVRVRDRWAGRIGYLAASGAAAVATFARMRSLTIELEAEGEVRRLRTPLVFVGVVERELRPPRLGARAVDGRRMLHVLVVRDTPRLRLRLLGMGLRAMVRGIRPWAAEDEVESLLVERCTVTLPGAWGRVAADGEIVPASGRLEYAYRRDALMVRVPREPHPGEARAPASPHSGR